MKITLEDAFIFSLIKWQHFSTNNYINIMVARFDVIEKYPFLGELAGACGLCEYNIVYKQLSCPLGDKCSYCTKFCDCSLTGHPYDIWSRYPVKKNAKKVYDLILEKANEYYEKGLMEDTPECCEEKHYYPKLLLHSAEICVDNE